MALRIGPVEHDRFTDEDLRIGWECHGDQVLEEHGLVGARPWGWWTFVAGEPAPRPDDEIRGDHRALEAVRLAELGELTAAELAALREEANEARLRVGTDSERISGGWRKYGISLDQRAVELWEALQSVVGGSA
jgi:hypothetical protein